MPHVENEQEFSLRQACSYVDTDRGALRIYKNGATIKYSVGMMWQMSDPPPEDSDEMRSLQYRYAAGTLENMVFYYRRDEKNAATQNMFHGMGAGPRADPAVVPYLKKLAEKIQAKEQLVAELKMKMESSRPNAPHIAAHNLRREQQQQEAHAMSQQLNALPRI